MSTMLPFDPWDIMQKTHMDFAQGFCLDIFVGDILQAVHLGSDGHLWCWICCFVDRILGMCWVYVDLQSDQFQQRFKINVGK